MDCPICHKAGLQNNTDICPQCNSDLTVFSLINNIQKVKKSNNNAKWIFSIIILSILFTFIYWQFPRTITQTIETKAITKIDSTEFYKSELASLKKSIIQTKDTNKIVKHIVIKGDYLSKISQEYFNDLNHINQIAKENRISNINLIIVGEILFIDLSKTNNQ